MKKITKISVVLVLGSSILLAGGSQMKLYDVKSGKIDYEIRGSGKIMGQTMQTIGKKRVIFDEYGAKNLTEENKIEKQVIMGQKQINKMHTLTYLKGGMMYQADFRKRRIIRMENMGMAMAGMMSGNQNMKQTGEKMMKQMGGKKRGTDKVLGYTCDVWELMGTKQCLYKGIPLRIESNMMGIKNTEVATKAVFDISLSKDDFKLPDFPVYDMQGSKLNRNNLNAMDREQSAKMSQGVQDAAKAMSAAMGALKESGFDMNNPNAKVSKSQEEAMKKAMMDAMGGEETMVKKAKQEILDEAKDLPEIKKCFQNANSVKEANICEQKADSEDPEHLSAWNEKIKSKMIKEITDFEKSIPCIKKASSFSALKQCMPEEQ